jgi:hypothetical protein
MGGVDISQLLFISVNVRYSVTEYGAACDCNCNRVLSERKTIEISSYSFARPYSVEKMNCCPLVAAVVLKGT